MTAAPLASPALGPETVRRLRELADRWTSVGAAERANYALYLIELCDAIGVERPRPASAGGRVAEESRGLVRWLRPAYQAPAGAAVVAPAALDLVTDAAEAPAAEPAAWPAEAVEQIGALKRLVTAHALTADEATRRFLGARREIVERHLETLAILGEVRTLDGDRYSAAATY